jgi:5-dehydro-2-deoxygluconokinase
VVLGLDAPADELAAAFRIAKASSRVKGFAIGRTIFADPARDWMAGKIDDATATQHMAERFAGLVAAWEKA